MCYSPMYFIHLIHTEAQKERSRVREQGND